MTNILITQGTHPFAQRLARSLAPGFDIRFGISVGPPAVLLQSERYIAIPAANAPVFVHELIKVCLDNNIHLLIPLAANELIPVAQASPLFAEYGIAVLVPSVQAISTFPLYINPEKGVLPFVLNEGKSLSAHTAPGIPVVSSGVFLFSDDGESLAICCVAEG